jgi:thiol:disulfide interchange protein DsbG
MFSRSLRCFSYSFMAALCMAALFSSASVKADAVPAMPEPLSSLAEEGAQIRFLGHDLGLEGWLVVLKGTQQFFYSTPDKKALLSGVLYKSSGELVTSEQLKRLETTDKDLIDQFAGGTAREVDDVADNTASLVKAAQKPSASDYANLSPSEQLFLTIENSNWVALGDKNAPVVYSFVDPKCPHCHDFVNDLRRGFLKRGMVQLRIIPVGLMDEESLKQAAYLLSAADAEERYYKHLDGDKTALPVTNSFNTDGVELNIDIMRGWGFDVTPFSIYRDASGKVKIVKGAPSRLETIINDLP